MDAPTPEIIKPKSGADDRAASTVDCTWAGRAQY